MASEIDKKKRRWVKEMTIQNKFLFFAKKLIKDGIPEISCPNPSCGYKISGWLATKIRKKHICSNCGKTFRVLELKNKRRRKKC